MSIELKVPEVGESITQVDILTWKKQEGDRVEKDETVAELETDKATVELPASASGVLQRILKKEGETVEVGEVIAQIESGNGEAAAEEKSAKSEKTEAKAQEKQQKPKEQPQEQKPQPKPAEASAEEKTQEPQVPPKVETRPHIMPAAKRALAKHQLRAEEVKATGPGGRLLKEDVMRHVGDLEQQREEGKTLAPSGPSPAPAAQPQPEHRREETQRMSPLRRKIAERLVDAQQQAALLTTFNEVNMTAVKELRQAYGDAFEKKHGVKLGFMGFFVKAAVDALKQQPRINAMIRDDSMVMRHYYDIGIAVSTERGLVVPVIRDADRLGFAEIEKTITDFAKQARENKIKVEDLEGGTFTITNGGIFGSLLSTPIVNPPQSGVLGMHTIQDRPVAINGEVKIAPMMYLALTYDHRIVDGREAVLFLKRIKETIENPSRLVLEV